MSASGQTGSRLDVQVAEGKPVEVFTIRAEDSIAVALYRLLRDQAFGPQEISAMTSAYEDILRALQLADRSDPVTYEVAKRVIECAQNGERDPIRLRDHVLQALQG